MLQFTLNQCKLSEFFIIILFGLFLSVPCLVRAETSDLVYPGADGSLEYVQYANEGQSQKSNLVPDFSYAGYQGGGVPLPEVPVVETIQPDSGDMRETIQSAIDRVSALPMNSAGFRGTILLKAGRYEVHGPLHITTSGVVLRGEGQKPAAEGGTELVAAEHTKHNFIQLTGDRNLVRRTYDRHLDTQPYPGLNQWIQFDVISGVQEEWSGDKIVTFHLIADGSTIAKFASKEWEEEAAHPQLVLTVSGGESVTLHPSDDTYFAGDERAENVYGTNDLLKTKFSPHNARNHREVLLKFPLDSVTDSVLSATLKLGAVKEDKIGDEPYQISAYVADDDNWDEDDLNWEEYYSVPRGPSFQTTKISRSFVPTGTRRIPVYGESYFQVGDTVWVTRTPNSHWIETLEMGQYGWTAESYEISYERVVVGKEGENLLLNAPLVQALSSEFGSGEVRKVSIGGRLEHCGVENLYMSSVHWGPYDEAHGWNAVYLEDAKKCWVDGVTAQYFGYSCVQLEWTDYTTIQECAMLDPVSYIQGGRRYSFKIEDGSFNLVQRCFTREGRHDYVAGSRVAGPNAFVDCVSLNTHADIGPHSRYTTGMLFDNIKGGQIRVRNRKDSGTGHGWAGAQIMFWNCFSHSEDIMVESPIGGMNWGIGCIGQDKNGAGYWEDWGTHVTPRSLYFQQLQDRLGQEAVKNVTLSSQRTSQPIWDVLEKWKGYGELSSYTTGIAGGNEQPNSYELSQNYPNPFNSQTTIQFSLETPGHVRLEIFDLTGKRIAVLLEKEMQAGNHTVNWNGSDQDGNIIPSGIYLCRFRTRQFVDTQRMLLLK